MYDIREIFAHFETSLAQVFPLSWMNLSLYIGNDLDLQVRRTFEKKNFPIPSHPPPSSTGHITKWLIQFHCIIDIYKSGIHVHITYDTGKTLLYRKGFI